MALDLCAAAQRIRPSTERFCLTVLECVFDGVFPPLVYLAASTGMDMI